MLNLLMNFPVLGLIIKLDELMPVITTTVIFVLIGLIVFAVAFLILLIMPVLGIFRKISFESSRWKDSMFSSSGGGSSDDSSDSDD